MVVIVALPASDAQPTRVEVVGYQRVRHALADGRPDPAAKDNAWVRTRTQWFLVADTDALPIDARGLVHVLVPGFRYGRYERREETGNPQGALAAAFREVGAPAEGQNGAWVRNGEEKGDWLAYARPAGQRTLHWTIRTIVDEVETHALEGRKAMRTHTYASWSVATQGWYPGRPYIPNREPGVTFEAGPHVQVDPPTFGYGSMTLPREDVPLG